MSRGVTGEIHHVDAGYHVVGMKHPDAPDITRRQGVERVRRLHAGPTLYFVRHGETDWNAEGRLQGQHDIPLNDVGRAQAARCGGILRELLARDGRVPADFDYVAARWSRARETMEIVRAALGLAARRLRARRRGLTRSPSATGKGSPIAKCASASTTVVAGARARQVALPSRRAARATSSSRARVRDWYDDARPRHRRGRPWRRRRGR